MISRVAAGPWASVLPVQTTTSPTADSPTGPRSHPSGRTEQLFGIRRHALMTERNGALNPAAFEVGPWCLDLDGRPTGAALARRTLRGGGCPAGHDAEG